MLVGFIFLLSLPVTLNAFTPKVGSAIEQWLGGSDLTIFFYVTALIIYCGIWLMKYLTDKEDAKKEQKAWLIKNVNKTKLISIDGQGSQSFTTTSGAIGRAAIGTLIAGPVGGIIGASTASMRTTTKKDPSKYMFMVYYKNGTRKHDTVTEKDWKFEIYMDHLDLGD